MGVVLQHKVRLRHAQRVDAAEGRAVDERESHTVAYPLRFREGQATTPLSSRVAAHAEGLLAAARGAGDAHTVENKLNATPTRRLRGSSASANA